MRLEKASKLLELAQALAGTAEGLTLDEMACRMEVNRRTAERMRDALRGLFPALREESDGRSKRYRIPARGLDSFFTAPTADELAELDLAIRAHDAHGAGARRDLLRSLAAKINAAMREDLRRRTAVDVAALGEAEGLVMQAGPRPLGDPATLAAVRDALKGLRLCVFDYAAASGQSCRRAVAPYGILFGRAWYLVGPERGKAEPMLWRFDRIANLETGEASGGVPDTFDLSNYAARAFGAFQEEPENVVLRFASAAADDARRFLFHPTQVLETQPDGSVVVRFEAGGMQELAHHLFTWGDAVEIVAPPRLKTVMVEAVRRALATHANS